MTYFICLDTSRVKDELWDVIWHNFLRNLSKHRMRKPHKGRWSRRPRLKVGPVQLKEFNVPSAIHPLLYGYEDSTPKCWNPSQLWWRELTWLLSSMLTPYEGCRARPSLPKSKLPTEVLDASRGRYKWFQDIFSPFPYLFLLVVHPGLQNTVWKPNSCNWPSVQHCWAEIGTF